MYDFPVDIVYLWCDGNDPEWRARKSLYDNDVPENDENNGKSRYLSNDELRYSLRSVETYAPWINHVFIVTDRQRPDWLDVSNPRVTVVDHSDIIPGKYLPLFNSTAIENWIFRIPGLSEHFLYANDDLFINAPVTPSFFFDAAGRPFVRLKHQNLKKGIGMYRDKVRHMRDEIYRRFHVMYHLAPHHCIDAYLRSAFEECYGSYPEWLARTSSHRFRVVEDLHRSIIGYYMLATGKGVMLKVSRFCECHSMLERIKCFLSGRGHTSSCFMPLKCKDYWKVLRKYSPMLFALNDESSTTAADRERAHKFMEERFPKPSSFEIKL